MTIAYPTAITTPWANSGNKNTIPVTSQIGIVDGAASFTDGFPQLTLTSLLAGGVPPDGEDLNGILNIISRHFQLQSAGLRYRFDATLAAAIGGYPQGAVLQEDSGTTEYVSAINNNMGNFNSNPALIGSTWYVFSGTAAFVYPGSIYMRLNATVPTGYLECDGSIISRATYAALFAKIGTMYGAGNGSTTFQIPDFRGYFLRGWAHGSTADPDRTSRTNRGDGVTGDSVGTKQGFQIRSHAHSSPFPVNWVPGTNGSIYCLTKDWQYGIPTTYPTSYIGGNETRPVNINVMYVIKY